MRLALFQPDIPQNLGAALRLCACLDVPLDVIEPCGFPLSDKAIRRAAMDYGVLAEVRRHTDLDAFLTALTGRLLLFTTLGAAPYDSFAYRPDDVLAFGRESAGAPESLHAAAHARLCIPLRPGPRSLNVVTAAAMALAIARDRVGPPLTP